MAACSSSGDSGTGPSAGIAGSYQLNSVDGVTLPAVLSGVSNGPGGSYAITAVSGALNVTSGGSYTIQVTEQQTTNGILVGQSTMNSSGTYAGSGGSYTFTDNQLGTGRATAGGGAIIVTLQSTTYRFIK